MNHGPEQAPASAVSHVREFADYRLIATLGTGGTAKVFLALKGGQAGFSKLVVVKALRRELIASPEHVEMFLEEARLSARLSHPNLVQTFEVGGSNGHHYIEMEYLAGQSLRSIQRRLPAQAFPLADQLRVLVETARGLHHAHELLDFDQKPIGIVHRDVSPQNVLVTYDGHVKLLDFGIAKTLAMPAYTEIGVIKGKANYLAPEQVRSESVDRRADIFALGVMLYQAITGRSFSGGPAIPTVTRLHTRLRGGEPNIRQVQPNVPDELAELVDSTLALDPWDRLTTANSFAEALEAYLERQGARPTAARLATLLDQPFAEDRAQLAALIESQTRHAHRSRRSALRESVELPVVDNPDTLTAERLTAPHIAPVPEPPASGQQPLGATSADAPIARGPAPTPPPPAPQTVPSLPFRSLRAIAIGLCLGAAGSAAGLAWIRVQPAPTLARVTAPRPGFGTQESSAEPHPKPAPAVAAPPHTKTRGSASGEATPAETARPEMVRIRMRISPAFATVTLDDQPLEIPADLAFERGDKRHVLRASARGYASLEREISQDEDASLNLYMRREARPKVGSASARGSDNPPESSSTPEPAGPSSRR